MRFRHLLVVSFTTLLLLVGFIQPTIAQDEDAGTSSSKKPNILMIVVDDLNSWVGYFEKYTKKGHKDSLTPNFDRLSAMGVSFTNAHASSTICNPSRAAIWSGMRPETSGCYSNKDYPWKSYINEGLAQNAHFKKNGYYVAGMGKTYHSSQQGEKDSTKIYVDEWNDYPKRVTSDKWDKVTDRAGFTEPLKVSLDEEDEPDFHTASYCAKKLKQSSDDRNGKPLFLVCGMIKPHLPWAVPDEFYEPFPENEATLPLPKYPSTNDWKEWREIIEEDLEDIPRYAIKEMSKIDKEYAEVIDKKVWGSSIANYLASIHWVDFCLGRILDALEESPEKDNTIIVLWSDHGYHLGEKGHHKKQTLWSEASDVPYIWVVPGVTSPGSVSNRSVDLQSIYPTLCKLAGLPVPEHVDGDDITPLLENPRSKWSGVAKVTMLYNNHAVINKRYRYIRYQDGSEELYNTIKDPGEMTNLAKMGQYKKIKKKLAKHLPRVAMNPWHDGSQDNNVKKSCNNKDDTVKPCDDGKSFVARDPNKGCKYTSCPS